MSMETLYLLRDGEKSGPFGADEVRAMVASGEVTRKDWAWTEGLPEWRPLDQVLGFDSLPPLPPLLPLPPLPPVFAAEPVSSATTGAKVSEPAMTWSGHPPLVTISGGLGLLLLVLSVFSVGSCSKAERDLQNYWSATNSPEGMTELLLRGFDRGMKGDPFGQVFDMADTKRSLESRLATAQTWAVLCLIGTGICGGALLMTMRRAPKRDGNSGDSNRR